MNKLLLLVALPGLLCFAPLALAHPGHAHDSHGWFASIVHSFMGVDSVLFLLVIGAGVGLWAVTQRVTQTRQPARRR